MNGGLTIIRTKVEFKREKLIATAKALGVTLQFLMYDQARLLGLNLVQITAPSKKLFKDGDKPTESERKIGENAVTGDLNKILVEVGENNIADSWDVQGYPAVAFRTRGGSVYAVEKTMVDLRGVRIAEHHKKYRNPRSGRVKAPGSETREGYGKLKFVDKLAVKSSPLKKYRRQLWKDVGTLKAGWVRGAMYFASKCNGKVNPPPWVARNVGRTTGRGAGGSINEKGFGNLYIENTSPFAKTKTSAAMIAVALRTREKDINKQIINRKDRIVEQYNGGQTPQPIKGAA
jgi:hypothetical protein